MRHLHQIFAAESHSYLTWSRHPKLNFFKRNVLYNCASDDTGVYDTGVCAFRK